MVLMGRYTISYYIIYLIARVEHYRIVILKLYLIWQSYCKLFCLKFAHLNKSGFQGKYTL